MSRKKETGREQRYTRELTLRLEPDRVERLDEIAESETRDRANVLRIIIDKGIAAYDDEGRL